MVVVKGHNHQTQRKEAREGALWVERKGDGKKKGEGEKGKRGRKVGLFFPIVSHSSQSCGSLLATILLGYSIHLN